MITPSNLTKHELIGLKCEALSKAENKKIDGCVVDETRNTLVMMTERGKRTLIKEKYKFVFKLPEKKVIVDGENLVGKPKDRIKKKIDKW
ncbi:MAG: ribonuclease P protein subunit [Candidatus Aenigmarchaeota archaeon]|nr:ribonuclease P protein subunit [Candidatus Aenigmarchaeota archaeon]